MECLPNRLTPLYSKIHYKEENYLKVKTKLLIYPFPPHSKGWYVRYGAYTSDSIAESSSSAWQGAKSSASVNTLTPTQLHLVKLLF